MKNKSIYILLSLSAVLFVGLTQVRAQESTSSAETNDVVREKVQEKIENIKRNPKAFLGVITDITDQTFQIRNNSGQIQQISLNTDTAYVKVDSSDDLQFEDIAIGDYQAALGYLDDSEVLSATRILIVDEPNEITRKSLLGSVSEITKSTFVLTTSDESYEVGYGRYTDFWLVDGDDNIETDATDVEDGDEVIIVGNKESDGSIDAYHIQVIKKAEIETPTQDSPTEE